MTASNEEQKFQGNIRFSVICKNIMKEKHSYAKNVEQGL